MKPNTLNLIITGIFCLLCSIQTHAQNFNELDEIPHDIVYFRANKITPPAIKVLYGRPKNTQEVVFGTTIPYDKVWKAGANEAAEIKFYSDVIFGNKKVKAGTYVLYAIPNEKEWTVILSTQTDPLATTTYNEEFDVVRVKAIVSKAEPQETFSIGFKKKENHVNMIFGWGTTRATVPVQF